MMINNSKKLMDLTVDEYLSLQKKPVKKYEYGIIGIAKIFGCSKTQAQRIKSSGDIDEAIFQNKNTIIIDIEKALELFGKNAKR